MKPFIPALLVGALLGSSSLVACAGAERSHDCSRICDGYATCVDPDLDKASCVDTCEERGRGNARFAVQASECEACLADEECGSVTLNCSDKCAEAVGEVPSSPTDELIEQNDAGTE